MEFAVRLPIKADDSYQEHLGGSMPIGLAVALAGGLGAYSRYLVDFYAGDHLESHHQVYVTLVINVAGALLLGLLIGVQPADRLRVVLGVGYLASFTTFSTFVSQVYHAMGDDHYATGLALPVLSVVLGVIAIWAGVSAGRSFAT
jgi:CrcB protein